MLTAGRVLGYNPSISQLTATEPGVDQLRAEWLDRATRLVDQVAGWAAAEGWPVDRRTETITERQLGTYDLPAVVLHAPAGDVAVTPIGWAMIGRRGGRFDVEAEPTLSRVMLIGQPDHDWQIMTDSNVPIRQPWTAETFVQLCGDLLA